MLLNPLLDRIEVLRTFAAEGNVAYKREQLIVGRIKNQAVELEKDNHHDCGRALITVDEGAVARQRLDVGGGLRFDSGIGFGADQLELRAFHCQTSAMVR